MTEIDLKTKAQQLFRDSKYEDAADLYGQALRLKGSNTLILNSNLSACYFELGNYQKSKQYAEIVKDLAIESKKSLIEDSEQNQKILDKNLFRIKKCNDFQGELNSEFNKFDLQLKVINSLPRYRPCIDTSVLEYYPVGHDKATSALTGKQFTTNGDKIQEDKKSRISLNNLDKKELSSLRFFLGGFGDARHIYSSLIDLHKQASKLPIEKRNCLNVHFVLNDIKPHPIAKLLIMFSAFSKLSEFEYSKIGNDYEATKAAAVLMYVFVSNVMPAYIAKEVNLIIANLIESESLNDKCPFLRIDKSSWQKVVSVLKQWSEKPILSTQKMMKVWSKKEFDSLIGSTVTDQSLKTSLPFAQSNDFKFKLIEQLKEMPKSADSDKLIKALEKMSVMDFMEFESQVNKSSQEYYPKNAQKDNEFVNKRKFLLPPFVIRDEKEKLLTATASSSDQELDDYVKKTWKPNVTMLDYDWTAKIGETQIDLVWDYGDTLNEVFDDEAFIDTENPQEPSNPKSMFDWYAFYFYKIAKSLKFLTKDTNSLVVETRVGDVNDVLSNIYHESKGNEESFKNFDRIFLSNIPDYTSLIYVFLECMPLLKPTENSFIKSTCLLNTGMWKDYEQYVYSGSLIHDLKKGGSLLNVAKVGGDLWGCDPLLSFAYKNFKPDIHSRNDVLDWVTRVLLTFSYPARRDALSPMRENYSPNLAVFFRSIQYLIWLGYPKHWFQAYLTSVMENSLAGTESPPIESPNRFRFEETSNKTVRKIDLSTILLEIRTLASIYIPLFDIGYISFLKPIDSIYEYKIRFEEFVPSYYYLRKYSDVLGLLFESSASELSYPSLNSNINLRDEILMHKSIGKKHLFSVLKFSSGNATFYMSNQDFDSMTVSQTLEWYVSVIRTDSWDRVTQPNKLSKAKKIKKLM